MINVMKHSTTCILSVFLWLMQPHSLLSQTHSRSIIDLTNHRHTIYHDNFIICLWMLLNLVNLRMSYIQFSSRKFTNPQTSSEVNSVVSNFPKLWLCKYYFFLCEYTLHSDSPCCKYTLAWSLHGCMVWCST